MTPRTVRINSLCPVHVACVGALLWSALLGAGCNPQREIHLNLGPTVRRPPAAVVLFFVDGMDLQTMELLRTTGQLPNIDHLFEDNGIEVQHAVTSIPAVTYANTVSLFTGCFPGTHGIVGNTWFDPRDLRAVDYITLRDYLTVNQDFTHKTIYEMLDDRLTFNVHCPTRRGAAVTLDNPVLKGAAFAVQRYANVDELVGGTIEEVGWVAWYEKRWPELLVHYFPGVDEIGHTYGANSHEYREALRNIDRQIGRVVRAVQREKVADRVYFILTSDHGHVPADPERVIDLTAFLKDRCKLRVATTADAPAVITAASREDRLAALEPFDAFLVDASHRHGVIHLRDHDGWGRRPAPDRIQHVLFPGGEFSGPPDLCRIRGIALVCHADGPDRVRIYSRRESALIERRLIAPDPDKPERATLAQYRIAPDAAGRVPDPLRYRRHGLADFLTAGWHGSRDWLAATADTEFPDFVPQIVEYFDSVRAGDIVVFTSGDYAFTGHHAGNHGSAVRRDLRIPMFFAGPGLKGDAEIPCARIVDVVPTILQMLGRDDRLEDLPPIDGVGLLPQLKTAVDR